MENTPPPPPKNFFFFILGIFCLDLGKNILFGIGNGAEIRPHNQVIESPRITKKEDSDQTTSSEGV